MSNTGFICRGKDMSKLFEMKEEFKLGVPEIDEQHAKLFEIGDRAYELLTNSLSDDKYDRIMEILDELREYTVVHFQDEERYMQEVGHRKLLSHKVEHDEFIKKVGDVDLNAVDQNQDEYIMEILNFLAKWLQEHILEKDMLIVS